LRHGINAKWIHNGSTDSARIASNRDRVNCAAVADITAYFNADTFFD